MAPNDESRTWKGDIETIEIGIIGSTIELAKQPLMCPGDGVKIPTTAGGVPY